MARKKILEAVADGGRKPEPEETSLDHPEKQMENLIPELYEVKTANGPVSFKVDLTPNLVFTKAILNDIGTLMAIVFKEAGELSQDFKIEPYSEWYKRNYAFIRIAYNRLSVTTMASRILSILSDTPLEKLLDKIATSEMNNFIEKLFAIYAEKLGDSNEKKS